MEIILFLFGFTNFLLSTGNCQFRLEPVDASVTQEQGKSLTMQWNIVDRNNTRVFGGALYLGKEEDQKNLLYEGLPKPEPQEVDHFGNRSKLEFTNDLYKVTIANLQYTDGGSYLLRVFLSTGQTAQNIITVKVVGGPEFCKGDLKSSYNFNSTQSAVISLTLCGVPAPTLTWRLHDGAVNSTQHVSRINDYEYKYMIELPELTQRLCGRILQLNATVRYNGTDNAITKTSTLFLESFKPEQVYIKGFFGTSDNKCSRRVEWKPLDTGCRVEYNIRFLDSNGAILGNETVNMDDIDFFCADNFTNASSVKMSATFKGVTGIYSGPKHFEITTTTTTPMTTAVTRTAQESSTTTQGRKPDDNKTTIIIIVVVVVLGLLVAILVAFIVIKKQNKSVNAKAKKSEDDVVELKQPSYTDEGDYASVDAMQKKTTVDKNSDQMLYAELGAGGGRKGPKPEPVESNYAQVKVDDMGYPARGPASDTSQPPQYPTSINRDRSRRHSPPPNYGEMDDDDGVIV